MGTGLFNQGILISCSPQDPERGALIFSTPPYPRWRRFIAAFMVISALIVPFIIVGRYIQLTLVAGILTFDSGGFAELLVLLLYFSVIFFILGLSTLYPKLAIYQNGLTRFAIPIFTNREGDFVKFANIETFSVSRNRLTCAIIVHNRESPLLWHSGNPKHILPIVDTLRKNGIPETE